MTEIETGTWFDTVGDTLTRLSLDVRSAIKHSSDNESRIRAFALLHLSTNTSQILANGVWGDVEEAAKEAATYLVTKCRQNAENFPEWLMMVANKWDGMLQSQAEKSG